MSEKASHWWPYLLVVALSAMFLLWQCSLPVSPAVSPTPTPVFTVTPLRAEVVGSPTATPPSTATAAVVTATAFVAVPTSIPSLTPLPPTATSTATPIPDVLPVQIVTPRPMPTSSAGPPAQIPRGQP
jgi:hypothetical protein